MQVQIRSREDHVQTRMRRAFKAVQSHIDVTLARACQRRDRAIANFARHGADAFQITARSDREAGLNNVHAKRFKLPRHAYFFWRGHGKSGRLLAVPQRGIEDAYDIHEALSASKCPALLCSDGCFAAAL